MAAAAVVAPLSASASEDVLRIAASPDRWVCSHSGCGSTSDLWLSLCERPVVCCDENDHVAAFMAKNADAVAWLGIAAPQQLVNKRTGRNLREKGLDVKLLATVAQARNRIRALLRVGGDGLARSRGWERVRAAVRLFGLPYLARSAQLQRRREDAKATALLRWQHMETWRAFRTWKRAAAERPAAPDVAVAGKRRERGRTTQEAAPVLHRAGTLLEDVQPAGLASVPSAVRDMDGRTGLRNLGNTCYMNSTLQALLHAAVIRHVLFSLIPPARRSISDMITSAALGIQLPPSAAPSDAIPPPPLIAPRLQRSNSALADVMDSPSPPVLGGAQEEQTLASAAAPTRSTRGTARTQQKVANTMLVAPLHEVASRIFGAGERLAVYTPDAFLKAMWIRLPQFSGFNQHDAEEFCRALLNALHDELVGPNATPATTSPLADCVSGAIATTIECTECGYVSRREETWMGPLSLEIPLQYRSVSQRATASCPLQECFDACFAEERLEGPNAYACDSCSKRVAAVMRRRISRTPPVLVLHIIRTDWTTASSKVQTQVEAPFEELSLSRWLESSDVATAGGSAGAKRRRPAVQPQRTSSPAPTPPVHHSYSLQSMVQHHGRGVRQGHYVAFAREGDFWYSFNDSKVSHVQEAEVRAAQAYLLVYQSTHIVYA